MKLKKYLGLIPLAVYSLVQISILAIEKTMDVTIRNTPHIIMMWWGILSVLFFVYWLYKQNIEKNANKPRINLIKTLSRTFFITASLTVFVGGLCVIVFNYQQEFVVERHGKKMVAYVDRFLDDTIYYHEYKNPLFYTANPTDYEIMNTVEILH